MIDNFTVYKHTTPNGKIYVGITSQPVERRWGLNGNGYKNQLLFWRAIQKYGWENITHEIIEDNLTFDLACEKEIEMIKIYKSNQKDFGYNIESGGLKNKEISEESRKKMSEKRKGKPSSRLGKKHTKETKAKISEHRKGKCVGKDNPFFGKHHSEETKEKLRILSSHPRPELVGKKASNETREKLSESHKGKPSPTKGKHFKQSEETVRKKAEAHQKKIICIETGEEYLSSKIASKTLKIDSSSITAVCKGRRKTAGGYSWKYA